MRLVDRVAALEERVYRLEEPARARQAAALAYWEREADWGRQVDAAVKRHHNGGSGYTFEAPEEVRRAA